MNPFENILERLEDWTFNADVMMPDGDRLNNRKLIASSNAKEIVQQVEEEFNNGWIPVSEKLPNNNNYIMVSFNNFSFPDIARYEEDKEGGAFYPGDEEKSYASFGLFVNAWQPLPEPYKQK